MAAAVGITLAADALRIGQRLGDELGALALGLGRDDLRLRVRPRRAALRAMPSNVRFMLSYTLRGDFFLQVDALQAHVDELDAELSQRLAGVCA